MLLAPSKVNGIHRENAKGIQDLGAFFAPLRSVFHHEDAKTYQNPWGGSLRLCGEKLFGGGSAHRSLQQARRSPRPTHQSYYSYCPILLDGAAWSLMTTTKPSSETTRVAAIDLIRGTVMILMAIDHVRVYSGLPAGGPTPGIFFTRWITHFCAPAFVFLAGTSAFFYGRRHPDLSRHLLFRGAWLILLELTVLRVGVDLQFRLRPLRDGGGHRVIGWSMILLAGLVKLPLKAVAHDWRGHHRRPQPDGLALRCVARGAGSHPLAWLWKILYVGFFAGPISLGPEGPNLIVLYSIIPWIGVMAAGYAFGSILALEPARRNRLCLTIGLGAIALFLVLRGFNIYGDPRPWTAATVARPMGRRRCRHCSPSSIPTSTRRRCSSC